MRIPIVITAAVGALVLTPTAFAAQAPQYVLPVNDAATISVLATSGDIINGKILRGTPDGMGVLKNSDGTITILSNHEISISDKTAQLAKATTGTWGSSISKLTYNPSTGTITALENLISSIQYFDYNTKTYTTDYTKSLPAGYPALDSFGSENFSNGLNRFCSGNLMQAGTLAAKDGKKVIGYSGAVYLTAEEGSDNSRVFAFDMNGNGVQLPKMGLGGYENALTNPASGKTTLVMLNEDGAAVSSQLNMYVGTKQEKGANFAEKAGLTNGQLYSVSVKNARTDNKFRANYKIGEKVEVSFNPLNTDPSYADVQAQAQGAGTTFSRVEDGEWDPKNPNVYYFLTTESNKDAAATAPNPAEPTTSRDGGALWRLTFKDVKNPLKGASIEMLLNGTEAPYLAKPDNLAIDESGHILIQEDPGNNAHVSRVIAYRISDGKLGVVAQFDKTYFAADATSLITIDEESSGMVNANAVLRKAGDTASYFFFNAQVHTTTSKARLESTPVDALDQAAIEGGQYYLLKISDWNKIFS
ncbi:MAG: alkaline phosphatase PhoX [Candidatus Planktophila sp.]